MVTTWEMRMEETAVVKPKISLGAGSPAIGLEVMITFDDFMYEPDEVAELETMLLKVTERWWKMREFRNTNRGLYLHLRGRDAVNG